MLGFAFSVAAALRLTATIVERDAGRRRNGPMRFAGALRRFLKQR
jgi:hypothetical protein